MTLTVQPDGKIWWAGRPTEPNELENQLVVMRRQAGNDFELRVRCDRSVPYAMLEPILASAARAEIWNLTFAVVAQQER